MKVIVERTHKKIVQFRVFEGKLIVSAHRKLDMDSIKKYIEENKYWIEKKLKKAEDDSRESNEAASDKGLADIFSCKAVLLCGEKINVAPTTEKKTYLKDETLYVHEKSYESKPERQKAVCAFIKKTSKLFLAEEISKFGTQIALCPTRIEFKALNGDSWVSCGNITNKIVCLDYRTIQLPSELQKYLIVHAFSHFYEGNHDRRFWNIVSNYMPHYEQSLKALPSYSYLKDIF